MTPSPADPNLTPEGRDRYRVGYARHHLREMQLALLDILRHVARLCERHDIPYWLDSGTLLGAVRHGGFIPWDDDIDICIPREDLARFTAAAAAELPPHLFVQTPETEPQTRIPICKVRNLDSFLVEYGDDFARNYSKGLYIDIFPMEAWPSLPPRLSRSLSRGYCRANAILHAKHYYSLRACAELFYFGLKRACCRGLWSMAKLLCDSGKYYSNTIDNSGNGNRHLRATVFPLSRISFEGEDFAAPADPDRYLRDLFGDYRRLPPEDQRRGHAVYFAATLSPTPEQPS